MMNFLKRHGLTIALFLAGLGAMLSGLTSWHDATTPAFIAGVLIQISAVIKAYLTEFPDGA